MLIFCPVSELVFSARRQENTALGHTVFTADVSGRAFSRLVDVNSDEDPPTGAIYGMEYDLQTGVLVYADRDDKSLWRVPLQRIIMATDLREVSLCALRGLCIPPTPPPTPTHNIHTHSTTSHVLILLMNNRK